MVAGFFSLTSLTHDVLTENQINLVAGAGLVTYFAEPIVLSVPTSGSLVALSDRRTL